MWTGYKLFCERTGACLTMRFGSTAKVLAKCMLKYYRISECVCHVNVWQKASRTQKTMALLPHLFGGMSHLGSPWCSPGKCSRDPLRCIADTPAVEPGLQGNHTREAKACRTWSAAPFYSLWSSQFSSPRLATVMLHVPHHFPAILTCTSPSRPCGGMFVRRLAQRSHALHGTDI